MSDTIPKGGSWWNLVEKTVGRKLDQVAFNDRESIKEVLATTKELHNAMSSMQWGLEVCWQGKATAVMTSKKVLEICPPKGTYVDVFRRLPEEPSA